MLEMCTGLGNSLSSDVSWYKGFMTTQSMNEISTPDKVSLRYFTGKPESGIAPSGVVELQFKISAKDVIKVAVPSVFAESFRRTYTLSGPVKLNGMDSDKLGRRDVLEIPEDQNFVKGLGTRCQGVEITIGDETKPYTIVGYAEIPASKDHPASMSLKVVESEADGAKIRLVPYQTLAERTIKLHYSGDGKARFDSKLQGNEVVIFTFDVEGQVAEGEDFVLVYLTFDVPLESGDIPKISYRLNQADGDAGAAYTLAAAATVTGLPGFSIDGALTLVYGAPFKAEDGPTQSAIGRGKGVVPMHSFAIPMGAGARGLAEAVPASFNQAEMVRSEVTGFASFLLGADVQLPNMVSRDLFFQASDLKDAAVVTHFDLTGVDEEASAGNLAVRFKVPEGEGTYPMVPATCSITLSDGTRGAFRMKRAEPGDYVLRDFAANDQVKATRKNGYGGGSIAYLQVNDPGLVREFRQVRSAESIYEITSSKELTEEQVFCEFPRFSGRSASIQLSAAVPGADGDAVSVAPTYLDGTGTTIVGGFAICVGKGASVEIRLLETLESPQSEQVFPAQAIALVRMLSKAYREIPEGTLSEAQEAEKAYLPLVVAQYEVLQAVKAKADAVVSDLQSEIEQLHASRSRWIGDDSAATHLSGLTHEVGSKVRGHIDRIASRLVDAEIELEQRVAAVATAVSEIDRFTGRISECLSGMTPYSSLELPSPQG